MHFLIAIISQNALTSFQKGAHFSCAVSREVKSVALLVGTTTRGVRVCARAQSNGSAPVMQTPLKHQLPRQADTTRKFRIECQRTRVKRNQLK
jgi:hypothetical protein